MASNIGHRQSSKGTAADLHTLIAYTAASQDPGNWATDISGGAKFGYTLLFVILLSNLAAMFLQHLALKLGVAADRDLAQACR